MWRSGACQAVLLHKCLVGIACYGSSAVSAQLSEQCVRRTASQRERGLTALPAQKCGNGTARPARLRAGLTHGISAL